jgi:hypothetical protein
MTLSSNIIKSIETISTYSGYDITGLEKYLMNSEEFQTDLLILSAETDIS